MRTEFRSILSLRQQHGVPGAFGKSDMYVVCRLRPRSFRIDFCRQECLRCEWLDLADLAAADHATPVTSRVARLLLYGVQAGFSQIDLTAEEFRAAPTGRLCKLYHRDLPDSYRR